MSNLFSFQGKVSLGDRSTTGKMLKPVWVGNAKLVVKLSTDQTEKNESFSGQRQLYGTLDKAKKAEVTLTLDEWTPENLAMALYASKVDVASGTATGEALPAGLVAGDMVQLDHRFISALTLTDSAATPATVPTASYSIDSANAGLVQLLDVGTLTQPFKAAYSYAAATLFTMFTKTPGEKYVLLDGVNTENDDPVIAELFRTKFKPAGQLDLITDEYGSLELTGACLYDSINAKSANMGGFGRFIHKAAG